MMMKKVCVVIPVHSSTPDDDEKVSLLQCRKILFAYDIFLVHPVGLDISFYNMLFPEILLQPVSSDWLSSLQAYNAMKRNKDFYSLFKEYEFMLTYELDAYIFSNDWNKASCFEYDYIGAPWFENYGRDGSQTIKGVGNSGFSMRNIQSCLNVLQARERIKGRWQRFRKLYLDRILSFALLLRLSGEKNWKLKTKNYYFIPFTTDQHLSEDIFWGSVVPHLLSYKLASVEDSIKFSFEVHPSELYKRNNNELPLGCHAWQKYDSEFWTSFIA